MARSALSAPAHVILQRQATGQTNNSPDAAPSLSYGGGPGILDSRLPWNKYNPVAAGQGTGCAAIGWFSNIVLNQVPSAISAVNIAASQSPGAGAITLVSTTGAGITVLSTAFTAWPSRNVIPIGACAIDGNPGYQKFGIRDNTWFYDQTTFISRAVRITSGGNDSGINFTVNGYDAYGYPQTQTLAGANAGVVTTTKTFKWITSVTHTGSVASTMSIGTADVYGFPLATNSFGYCDIVWAGTTITSSTGFTALDTTNPATSSTGDVRGTYATQSASNGTNKLEISIQPNIVLLNQTPLSNGLFGVTPA
jgi:hypothetical protein